MDRPSWTRLAYSRPGGPIAILLFFVICSAPFLVAGLLLNESYAPVTALPLYPNAQAITLTTKSTAGLSGTPVTVKAPPPNSIPNYKFVTRDALEVVARFYLTNIEQIYGAQAVQIEPAQPGTFVIHGVRGISSGRGVQEQTTVTVTAGSDGLTHVEINVATH